MRRLGSLLLSSIVLLAGCQARRSARQAKSGRDLVQSPSSAQGRTIRHLCADLGPEACASACPPSLPAREHAECLINYRFSSDATALDLARALFAKTGALPGVDATTTQGSYGGAPVATRPALPIGEDRQHLAWILASFERYEEVFRALGARASRPIEFRLQPDAFLFFRTDAKTYPSAWGAGGIVGYNLDGPLHTSERDVLETLFHELFHLNDERRDGWSSSVLGDLFEAIVERCGDDHACLSPFAPHDTVVPDGTYYPFDDRTRDVREYAAELALRYYREHEAILDGAPLDPPFKCLSDENLRAWTLVAEDFFGGVDLTRDCADEDRGS